MTALIPLLGAAGAQAATFTHRTVVTIDHTKVPGVASLANFPVLVSVTSANLKTTANGGFVTSSRGYDIIFQGEDAPTCGGVYPPACRLDHEIESYDGVNGTIVAWVRVPAVFGSLSASDTPIYMYYGDATITCSQENKAGVWDSSYREVFHLNEPAEHTDSTKNAFAAASRGAVTEGVAGQVGPAVDLAGGASGAATAALNASDGTLPSATGFTFETWVNFRSYTAGNYMGIVTKGRECLNFDGDPDPGPGFCTVAPCGDWVGLYNLPSGGNNRFSWEWAYGGGCKAAGLVDPRAAPASTVQTNQWYHLAGTFDNATSTRRLFINGTQVATDTVGACITAAIPQYTRLGTDSNQTYMDGQLDEVRISFTARSTAWIQAGYNNQSNPNFPGFYSSIAHQTGSWTVTATACPSLNPCFGGPGTCYLRSIGNIAAYTTGSGSCTATNGSSVVTCPGATWVTANRGRGDRITIDAADYMVRSVDSETQLQLATPFGGTTGVGNKSYTMSRQFATPQAWEDCISTGGAACTYFPVANGDLVAGNRSEIGIIYKDASPYTGGGVNPILTINGSTTDANHTITLTADSVNRHYGIRGAGVVLDNGTTNLTRAVVIADQFVTVEWLEVARGGDPGAHCIDYVPSNATNHAVIRNNIVRNCSGQSIRLAGSATDHVADINNNFIFRGAREGIRIQSGLGTGTGSLVRIFNNTIVHNAGAANTDISTAETPNPYVVLRNNIIVDDAQTPDVTWNGSALCTNAANCDWWNAASSNNIVGDAAPPTGQWKSDIGPNPHGAGIASATEASLSFVNTTAGTENLHLQMGSAAWNRGVNLAGFVGGDIDAQPRTGLWDVGADELPGAAAPPVIVYSDNAASGTRPLQYTTYSSAWATPGTTGVTGSPPFHSSPLHQKVAVTSPNGTRAAVWTEDNPASRDYLYASFWDGVNWDDGAGVPFADAQTGFFQPCWDGVLNLRCFDAAYEQQSGRLLVVYGVNTTHTIRYRRYDGAWGAETSTGIPAAAFGGADAGQDGVFAWVHLASRPGSNQIAFLGLEDQASATPAYGAVTAAIWDGNGASWGSKQVLSLPTTNGQNGHLTDAADIKFVLGGANAGEAIAVWGNGQQVYSARWSQAGGWTASASVANLGAGNTVRWLRLAAKPQGDGMVLAIGDTNQRIFTQTYTGTTRVWGALSAAHSTTAYGSAVYNRPFDVVWDPGTGANNVLLVYSDTTRVRYRTSSDGGATWTAQQNQDITVRQAYWVQLVRDSNNAVHFALQDAANALQVYVWSGGFWAIPSVSVSANMERDANHAVEPYAVATYPPQSSVTTAVTLMSFSAVPADGAVTLEWRTGSELDNQGFHLYRGPTADGPWTRLTSSLIPGLGSSPLGKSYSWRDSGLVNGQRYFYRLEDVDTHSKSTFHGPVSAVPVAAAAPAPAPTADRKRRADKAAPKNECPAWVLTAYAASVSGTPAASPECTRHGNPEATGLDVLAHDPRSTLFELRTGGFYAVHTPPGASEPGGTVRAFVPGFDSPSDPKAPALPLRRALVDAVVGRKARITASAAYDQSGFPGLRPAALGEAEMEIGGDGTVRPGRHAVRAVRLASGVVPQSLAVLAGTVFQGEAKSAVVELQPLRYDVRHDRLLLAGRVRFRLDFSQRDPQEAGLGNRGRRRPPSPVPNAPTSDVIAELHTSREGVYAVAFEALFPGGNAALPVSTLSLRRQGALVPFRVAPARSSFGPGSVLYFYNSATAPSTSFSGEVAYQLLRSTDGVGMELRSAAPQGTALDSASLTLASFESNRFYQPGLLEAPDPWLWEALPGGAVKVKPFTLAGVDPQSPLFATLVVYLQGATDAIETTTDHHLRVAVNGIDVGETYFDGKRVQPASFSLPASLLREGGNELALTNVGDTGVSSMVFLDRFTLEYPQTPRLQQGAFDGTWLDAGSAQIAGVTGPAVVLDVTDEGAGRVAWLDGVAAAGGVLRFQAQALHRYRVATSEGLVAPRVLVPEASTLRDTASQADYLLVTPRAFLEAVAPLVERRESQGLRARAVAFEEIASVFGAGQPSAEAIREFLRYAYHSWSRPSPRYVLLVGDSTYDPRNFTGSSLASPLPALYVSTSYLVTASDPALAAVNGEDPLPDLAIGRLPARTPEEAGRLVAKLLAWEDSGQDLSGRALLVADNPDAAGDFEAEVSEIATSYLAGREVKIAHVGELGAATRPLILDSLNAGLSQLDYVGHGGAAVWASENVLNSWDVASLVAQSQQPLLVTMNCLNGYFVSPTFDALGTAFVKADGRGAIAAFSPSGLSVDGPAHLLHGALQAELARGSHQRLGDAVLAAQKAYAESGAMPELLTVYHLFGDPALPLRR